MENLPAVTHSMDVVPSFGSSAAFEMLQRQAKMLSSSSMVPDAYSIFAPGGKNKLKDKDAQNYAIANACIAIEMASRLGASALMVAQNLHVVNGRPGWSSQFTIASINSCGRFSPLRFSVSEPEPERSVTCLVSEWVDNKKVTRTITEVIRNRECIAWVTEKSTGEKLEGPPVSIEMAVKEGWVSKKGSKWKTMEGTMLRYRAASFFGRLYAPELLMGLRPVDELIDIDDDVIDVTAEPVGAKSDINDRFRDKQPADQSTPPVETKPAATKTAPKATSKAPSAPKEPAPPVVETPPPVVAETTPGFTETGDTSKLHPQVLNAAKAIEKIDNTDRLSAWLLKEVIGFGKKYGKEAEDFLQTVAANRRAFLKGEVPPGETPPAIVMEPTSPPFDPDDPGVEMIECPETRVGDEPARLVPKFDCGLSECSKTCPAFNAGGKQAPLMEVNI